MHVIINEQLERYNKMRFIAKCFVLISSFVVFLIPTIYAKESNDFYTYFEVEDFSDVPLVGAKNVLLYNLNDQKILYEKNQDEKIMVASLTKIMTLIVALEKIEDYNQKVIVSEEAFFEVEGYAEAGFCAGDVVTIRDLFYGTILPSGAEAAQAIALLSYGSIADFVLAMNRKAKELDMQNTNFSNPVGRDSSSNYSTLSDFLKLLFYALENETFYEIYTTKNYKTTNGLELSSTLVNASLRYALDIDYILGAKSGYTKGAGLCLSSIAEFNGTKYLLLVAGSPYQNGFPNHVVDSLAIYHYFFNNYSYQPILKENQELLNIPIVDSGEKMYTVKSDEDVFLYLKNDMLEKLEYSYEGKEVISKNVKTYEQLGNISVLYDGNVLYTYPVYLNMAISYFYTKEVFFLFGILFFFFLFLFCVKMNKEKS